MPSAFARANFYLRQRLTQSRNETFGYDVRYGQVQAQNGDNGHAEIGDEEFDVDVADAVLVGLLYNALQPPLRPHNRHGADDLHQQNAHGPIL